MRIGRLLKDACAKFFFMEHQEIIKIVPISMEIIDRHSYTFHTNINITALTAVQF